MPYWLNKLLPNCKVNNLITRSLTGIVFVLLIVSSMLINPWIFALLFFFITILTQLEFYQLMREGGTKSSTYIGIAAGIFLYGTLAASALNIAGIAGNNILLLNFIPLVLIFIFALYSRSTNSFADIGLTLTGILYIALPFGLLNYLIAPALLPDGVNYGVLLGFFLILWTNDTFAYITGMLIGKHKLYEKISPKKTWEGTIGGAILCITVTALLGWYLKVYTVTDWICIAAICAVFGTLGDLLESKLKR